MDLKLYIHSSVEQKLKKKHGVDPHEVHEVWNKYDGITLVDTREQHRSNPATEWFVAETVSYRKLKVIFIPVEDLGYAILRSCYEANQKEINLFRIKGGKI